MKKIIINKNGVNLLKKNKELKTKVGVKMF